MEQDNNEIRPCPAETAQRFILRKGEKLRHKSLVDPLFGKGETLYSYPLRVSWRAMTEEELESAFRNGVPKGVGPLQMLITVPKKRRKHAVDRVLVRRRVREAYRLNRLRLRAFAESHPQIRTISMAFIYIGDKNEPMSLISKKMAKLLDKILAEVESR